jgi:BMFP domain-containing protein YqiC
MVILIRARYQLEKLRADVSELERELEAV